MPGAWVLVAHESGARLFEARGPGKGLELIREVLHPEGRVRDRDIDTDRPGRSFPRGGTADNRSAMSREEGAHDRVVSDFARELAHLMREGRIGGRFQRLVLVAPPRLLGLLRSSLDTNTAQCVVGSLDKDLAFADAGELAEHVGTVLAV